MFSYQHWVFWKALLTEGELSWRCLFVTYGNWENTDPSIAPKLVCISDEYNTVQSLCLLPPSPLPPRFPFRTLLNRFTSKCREQSNKRPYWGHCVAIVSLSSIWTYHWIRWNTQNLVNQARNWMNWMGLLLLFFANSRRERLLEWGV